MTIKNNGKTFPRRQLLEGGAAILALGALGAYGSAAKAKDIIRPPGYLNEDDFLSKCLHCDRCRSICPTQVIGVGGLNEGLTSLRTPVMNFKNGYCDFCLKCIDVCPTGALHPADKETAKIGLAELTDLCIALRTGACTKCYEECPHDAIELSPEHRPIILPEKCNGCGMCEKICPANIFQAYHSGGSRGIIVRPLPQGGQL